MIRVADGAVLDRETKPVFQFQVTVQDSPNHPNVSRYSWVLVSVFPAIQFSLHYPRERGKGSVFGSVCLSRETKTIVPFHSVFLRKKEYSRTPLIRPPSESHWCGRIRGMVARRGFVYKRKALSVTQNVVVWEGWSLVRVVIRQGFYCIWIWTQECIKWFFTIARYYQTGAIWWMCRKLI